MRVQISNKSRMLAISRSTPRLTRLSGISIASLSTSSHQHLYSGNLVKQHAIDTLLESQAMISQAKQTDYTKRLPAFYNQTIGMHLRHALSHFDRVCAAGLSLELDTVLKYDVRERNTAVERSQSAAIENIQRIVTAINDMHLGYQTHVTAQFITINKNLNSTNNNKNNNNDNNNNNSSSIKNDDSAITYEIKTNLMRELSFCAHHCTHHIAMIKLMMDVMGYTQENTVGMAPSSILASFSDKTNSNNNNNNNNNNNSDNNNNNNNSNNSNNSDTRQHFNNNHHHHLNKTDNHHPELYRDNYRDKVTGKHIMRFD